MTNNLPAIQQFETVCDSLVISMTDELPATVKTLQEQYPAEAIPDDLSTKEGMTLVKQAIRDIKTPRLALEKDRKAIKAPVLDLSKKIDTAARQYREALETLETPWKQAKKDYDLAAELKKRQDAEAEQIRVEKISTRIAEIRALPGSLIRGTSADVATAQTRLELDNQSFDYMEFLDSAVAAYTDVIETLTEMYDQKDRLETAEREQEEREAKEKAEAKAREADEKRRLAEQKKEQDEAAAKLKAQQAEIDRQKQEIAEAAQKIEAVKEVEIKAAQEKKEREEAAALEAKKVAEIADAEEERQRRIAKKAAEYKAATAAKLEGWKVEAANDLNKAPNGSPMDIVEAIIHGDIRHIGWVD